MEFFTSSDIKRPVRLSEKTREFAYESINFKYGLETLDTPFVQLHDTDGMSDIAVYDLAVSEIVSKAPVRICDGELLSGAATLGDSIRHVVPVRNAEGKNPIFGVSHLTADFFTVLEKGINGIRRDVEESLKNHTAPRKVEFLKSCLNCIDCMQLWHARYIDALSEKGGYDRNIENLKRVPFEPARNFYEAVQSVWFCFAYLRLLGNWPGIGRIDVMLGKYLKKDLENGTITIDEAREILAHFFIKGCEWITGKPTNSGDAQHYQNLVISGIDENGIDVTNEVTYLVLDIIEETGISDFPTTVRVNKNTDKALVDRVSQVIRFGGGTVAVYNEDLVLRSLVKMGYEEKEARKFANDGCWEVQIPGKTFFIYVPFDGLAVLQKKTLKNYDGTADFDSFEALEQAYMCDLADQVGLVFESNVLSVFEEDRKTFKKTRPCTAVSLFEGGCVEKALSYFEGGPVYNVISPHIGGLPDVVNSLYAIKKAVFDEKLVSFSEFMKILADNWEGAEELRRHVINSYTYYGNDSDEVDEIAVNILGSMADACEEYDRKTPIRIVGGVSTFGRQLEWAPARYATPFGRKAGEVLSGNCSPTPGTDKNGAAAIIKSYCKADLVRQHTGAALDIGFIPSSIGSDNAVSALSGLIMGFVKLGGFFMQIDTVDKNTLIDAQKNPENYQNLSVRVSGWNARFVTMSKQWQDMIIERTK